MAQGIKIFMAKTTATGAGVVVEENNKQTVKPLEEVIVDFVSEKHGKVVDIFNLATIPSSSLDPNAKICVAVLYEVE